MSNLQALKRYFLTGAAEEDRPILSKLFITPDQLSEVIGIYPGTIRLLVGNKGIGKTAILESILDSADKKKLPAILLRPDDIDASNIGNASDLGTLKQTYYRALLSAVASAIGSKKRGLLVGESATLHAEASRLGAQDPDAIAKILTMLTAVSVPVAGIDGVKLAKELAGVRPAPALIRAINGDLLASGTKAFLLLVDDTDQVASPNDTTQLNRIWGLLLAVRRLAQDCPSIRCIVTLRSEIWTRLQSESAGQLDQVDHIRGMIVQLQASERHMELILQKRMQLAAQDVGRGGVDPYSVFFDGAMVHLPNSDERRSWDSFLVKSARERPRDAIQLVRKLIDRAVINQRTIITDREASEGVKDYSNERVSDLCNEFSQDCETLRSAIDSFSDIAFETDFDMLLGHLRTIGSRFGFVIRHKVVKPENDESALEALRFFHETGFINPRVSDARQPRGFRHISFIEDPNLIAKENWATLRAATWEIHPAFRSYLLNRKEAAAARIGAPRRTIN